MAFDSFVHGRVFDLTLETFDVIFILLGIFLELVEPLHALELGPRETDLFAVVAPLHRSAHVHVVVLNDSQDDV